MSGDLRAVVTAVVIARMGEEIEIGRHRWLRHRTRAHERSGMGILQRVQAMPDQSSLADQIWVDDGYR